MSSRAFHLCSANVTSAVDQQRGVMSFQKFWFCRSSDRGHCGLTNFGSVIQVKLELAKNNVAILHFLKQAKSFTGLDKFCKGFSFLSDD